jgi:mRNA interferase MazF
MPSAIGRRPGALLSRDEAYSIRSAVTVAEMTTKIRAIPVEFFVGPEEGLPKKCVINIDTIVTVHKDLLFKRIALLQKAQIKLINQAIWFALAFS